MTQKSAVSIIKEIKDLVEINLEGNRIGREGCIELSNRLRAHSKI